MGDIDSNDSRDVTARPGISPTPRLAWKFFIQLDADTSLMLPLTEEEKLCDGEGVLYNCSQAIVPGSPDVEPVEN